MRLSLPGGRKIDPSGRGPVPARRSVARERKSDALNVVAKLYSRILSAQVFSSVADANTNGLRTSGIYGRNFIGSSATDALQKSLASRLQARKDLSGSPEYALVWKSWDMALGPSIAALRASNRRTSGKDFSGWPTPNAIPIGRGGPNQSGGALPADAAMAGWGTPRVTTSGGYGNPKRSMDGKSRLEDQVMGLAGWAIPSSLDYKDTPGMATTGTNPDGSTRDRLDQLPRQAALVSGLTPNGFPAEITNTKGFLLNPGFSLWLQGFPEGWQCSRGAGNSINTEVAAELSARTSKAKGAA